MKKICKFLFLVIFVFITSFNVSFATETVDTSNDKKIFSTGEFDTLNENSQVNSNEKKINSYSLNQENPTLSKDEIVDIILNDAEFNEYVETELEHVYTSLTNFVLAKPEILNNFKTSLDITEPTEIKDFFKSLISSDDVKDCLISLLEDDELLDIFKNGNLDALLDVFYDTLDSKLSK